MSIRGKVNKLNGDFFSAVRSASMKGNVDAEGGIHGTRKIVGYVCEVHPLDDKNEKLRGTVDVQEFGYEPGEDKYEGAGYHEGVLCSAIQSNKSGVFLMPALYSDVIIVQDPVSLEEYVLMYSHVDVVQLQSRSKARIGVVETEEFKESEDDDDQPDMDDLKETGNSATTEYTKNAIIQTVLSKNQGVTITQTADKVEVTAKNASVIITADGNVTISAKEVQVEGSSSIRTSSSNTTIDGNTVEVTGGSFIRKGKANLDGSGGFCGIPVCPFTGAVHTGSTITGG